MRPTVCGRASGTVVGRGGSEGFRLMVGVGVPVHNARAPDVLLQRITATVVCKRQLGSG